MMPEDTARGSGGRASGVGDKVLLFSVTAASSSSSEAGSPEVVFLRRDPSRNHRGLRRSFPGIGLRDLGVEITGKVEGSSTLF
jgi:hypothetical protein